MIVDYLPADRLPAFLVWLDWNFWAYRLSWYVCVFLAYLHHVYDFYGLWEIQFGDLLRILLVGTSLWVVYCAWRYGYGVG